jgi:hypothetical protein
MCNMYMVPGPSYGCEFNNHRCSNIDIYVDHLAWPLVDGALLVIVK